MNRAASIDLARSIARQIADNAAAYGRGDVDYDVFHSRQIMLWDLAAGCCALFARTVAVVCSRDPEQEPVRHSPRVLCGGCTRRRRMAAS